MVTKKALMMIHGLLTSAVISNAIDFTRVNIAWQYDPLSEIKLNHRIIEEKGMMTVFFRFESDSLPKWSFHFLKQAKYDAQEHAPLGEFQLDTIRRGRKDLFFRLKFDRPNENLLIIKVAKGQINYYYDVWLKNGSFPFPSFYPKDGTGLPILVNYLNTSEVTWTGADRFYALGYQENFAPADPPMAKMKPLAPSLVADTAFQLSNPAPLKEDYFYMVRADTNGSVGVTVMKSHPYYPEFKRLDELWESMQYILNEAEKKSIQSGKNLKQSFDDFWLNTYKTKFRARNAIRNYYNWIEQANHLFTDFKQGWKTDRGMLFIVYGVPDEVYRTENNEEWYYDNGPAFEFTIIVAFFSPKTYALRRKMEFEPSWFEYIAAIRKGTDE